MGTRQNTVDMFTAVTTIQQLLKEEDIIVMKRRKGADKQITSQLVGANNL